MSIDVSTDRTRLDVAMIHHFLATESYWAQGISREDVEQCIAHSLCFGLYRDGVQVAFARVVTDRVRFGHIMDLFVVREHRSRGLGKLLIQSILDHESLANLGRFTLGTADAHSLYAQFGFKAPAKPETHMEFYRPRSQSG